MQFPAKIDLVICAQALLFKEARQWRPDRVEYSLKACQIWLNWCQYIWPVDANRKSIKMGLTCTYGEFVAWSRQKIWLPG